MSGSVCGRIVSGSVCERSVSGSVCGRSESGSVCACVCGSVCECVCELFLCMLLLLLHACCLCDAHFMHEIPVP